MSNKVKIAKKSGPGRDVQNVIRTFTLEMIMVSKVPKSYYSLSDQVKDKIEIK